jgi:large subunit ribosomal protein L30
MPKIKITQRRSAIDRPEPQKRTIRALGITKMNRPVVKEDTPQIRGMVYQVRHLVEVEEVN